MRIFSVKQRLIFLTSTVTGVLILVIFLIVYPSAKHILQLRSDIKIIQEDMEERYIKTQKLKKSVMQLSQANENAQIFETAKISVKDQLEVITKLEKIASQNKIEQTVNVSFTDEKKGNPADNSIKNSVLPQYYKFSFLNNGLFYNQINYLKDLEKLPYYVIIDNLQWEKRNTITSSTPVTLRFTATIYANL